MTTYRVAGWNVPGYLPETDPVIFDNWQEAHDYLVQEIDRRWDDDYDTVDTTIERTMIDGIYLPVHTALHVHSVETPFAESTGNDWRKINDLGVIFWMREAFPEEIHAYDQTRED